jgi:DNA-binding MarR family transcriptional regulator
VQLNDLIYLGRRLAQAGQLAMHEDTPDLIGAEPRVLADLLDRRFSTVTEISQRTGYTQGRVSTAVAKLREAGLVGARPDTNDRRRTVVFATLLADEHAAPLRHRGAEGLLEELLGDLDESQRHDVEKSLDILLERLRQIDLVVPRER